MPHRFRRSRASRPRVLSYDSLFARTDRILSLPAHTPDPTQPMATATVTPPIAKQRAYHFLTPRKDCNKDLLAWCEEIDGRIVSINASMNDFLHYFVPGSSNPPPLQATQPFDIPLGELEASMYEPLVGIDRPGMYQKLTLPFFASVSALRSSSLTSLTTNDCVSTTAHTGSSSSLLNGSSTSSTLRSPTLLLRSQDKCSKARSLIDGATSRPYSR